MYSGTARKNSQTQIVKYNSITTGSLHDFFTIRANFMHTTQETFHTGK